MHKHTVEGSAFVLKECILLECVELVLCMVDLYKHHSTNTFKHVYFYKLFKLLSFVLHGTLLFQPVFMLSLKPWI